VPPTDPARTAVRAPEALDVVRPMAAARPLLVVSDFDGTLSRIVLDPWGATILQGAQRALRKLAAVDGVHVALLSGRTVQDLAARARVGGATYVGNHGMERGSLGRGRRAEGISVEVVSVAPRHEQLAGRLADEVPRVIGASWLVVERKPASVAFHFRGAPDIDAAAAMVRAAVDNLDPGAELVRFPGRRVLELRPPGAPAKGEAFRSLLEERRPAAALMLGDDTSDALAFAVLREARAARELQGLAIGVQARDEVPADVSAATDLVLSSPVEAARFLAGLVRLVGSAGAERLRRAR
jgi:trehalose 6-phosphate phosphatase